ncbi:MAG: energy transducer TonB [Pyrinomonadaceae bacterium]|nr:energy transducer TonB [Pyrinomonadaceae bacterium]
MRIPCFAGLCRVAVTIAFCAFTAVSVSAQGEEPKGRVISQERAPAPSNSANIKEVAITDKPRAGYTETAKHNGIEGSVRLRVEFLADGTIGEVVPLSDLPYGLTEKAIAAAKQIRFVPKSFHGKPVDSTTTVEYTFSLYYEDEDAEITSKVDITRMPKPEILASELPASANRKIQLKVFFGTNGKAAIVNTLTPVPRELQDRLREAVEGIRFRPAVHRSGKRSGVTKVIVYEF